MEVLRVNKMTRESKCENCEEAVTSLVRNSFLYKVLHLVYKKEGYKRWCWLLYNLPFLPLFQYMQF